MVLIELSRIGGGDFGADVFQKFFKKGSYYIVND